MPSSGEELPLVSPHAPSPTRSRTLSESLGTKWSIDAIMNTSGITPDVQQHLVRVYSMLAACLLVSALSAGSTIKMGIDTTSWPCVILTTVVTIGGTIWLVLEPQHNHLKRVGILMTVAAGLGVSMSALIGYSLEIDPSIVVLAFLLTTLVFLCFTASALLATRRSFLFLGGILSSMLTGLIVVEVANLFLHSPLLWSASLYGGLFLFCAYVVFDTQMIIEQASNGDKDYLLHALNLFLDFVSIFIRILAILAKDDDHSSS